MDFIKKNRIAVAVGIIVLATGGFYFMSGSGGGDTEEILPGEYDTFTQCLYDGGLRVYGSATCSQCARQRRSFGNSWHLIKEVECDPRNPEFVAGQCLDDISHTPTWIKTDADGNETYRFKSGFVKLEELSTQSGCPLVKDEIEVTS